jgi:hypothetical protein
MLPSLLADYMIRASTRCRNTSPVGHALQPRHPAGAFQRLVSRGALIRA